MLDGVLLGVDTGVTAFGVVDILRAGVCSFLLAIVDFLAVALDVFLLAGCCSVVDFRLFLVPFSGNRGV